MTTYYVDHKNGRDYYPPRDGLTPETAFASEHRAMLEIERRAAKKPPLPPADLTIILGDDSIAEWRRKGHREDFLEELQKELDE